TETFRRRFVRSSWHRSRSSSDLGLPTPQKSLRPDHQHEEQRHEPDRHGPVGAELVDYHRFHQSEDKGGHDRAARAAESAQNDDHESLEERLPASLRGNEEDG